MEGGLVVLLASLTMAQTPQWTVSVDPLTTALGFVHLQTEVALSERVSVYGSPSLKLFDFPGQEQEPYRGIGAELGMRVFWGRQRSGRCVAPCGPWVMGRTVLANVKATDGTERTAFGHYVSGLVGNTWIVDDVWVVSLGAGVQRMDYTVGEYGIEGILPALHTNIGLAF